MQIQLIMQYIFVVDNEVVFQYSAFRIELELKWDIFGSDVQFTSPRCKMRGYCVLCKI
jgi:hypothetical protein